MSLFQAWPRRPFSRIGSRPSLHPEGGPRTIPEPGSMKNAPAIHLAIIQPAGYVHSLGFLDQARYFRHMFRRQGATVTMAKNRLREDAVNFVFGAHLGFPADWQ